jgi:uncharacterized membrane protein (UPF0127 family)
MAELATLSHLDGPVVCGRCRVASTFGARLRGLLGRSGLGPGEGLLLPGTSSVHTHFMRFPIDVVFLDAEERVVRVVPSLAPWRMAAARGARSVLELAAGECGRLGVAVGGRLRISAGAEAGS